jgi:DNA invertase Pin-like site-specific DNA recombinase
MKLKAYSYIRFSSLEQAKGHSQKRQMERAREYAEKHSLELVTEHEYAFFDAGKSAYKARNLTDDGELRRFLTLVEDGSIPRGSYLLVENLDRLSREKVNIALPWFIKLLTTGIKVVTLTDERVYDENFSELDLIISIVQLSRAHEESASKGYRVSKAWQNKQAEARTHGKPLGRVCPAWLTVEGSVYRIIKSRAAIIELIFDMTLKGYGRIKIVKELNIREIPPFGLGDDGGPRSKRNKSGVWGTSSIAKILSNRALLGEYQPYRSTSSGRVPSGEPIQDFYPKVISEDLFYRAQREISGRKNLSTTKQSADFNIWQKISCCANCHSPMHMINKGKPPKGYKYLVCAKARKGACDGRLFRYDHLEMYMPRILFMLNSLPLVRKNNTQISNQIDTLEGQKIELGKKIEQYTQLLSAHPSIATAKVLAECEQQVRDLDSNTLALTETLDQDYLGDWESFTQSIDLKSYEGRFQANSLIRRLGVAITFASQRGDKEFDYPIDVIVQVAHKDKIDDPYSGFFLLAKDSDLIPEYQFLNEDYAERALHQGLKTQTKLDAILEAKYGQGSTADD